MQRQHDCVHKCSNELCLPTETSSSWNLIIENWCISIWRGNFCVWIRITNYNKTLIIMCKKVIVNLHCFLNCPNNDKPFHSTKQPAAVKNASVEGVCPSETHLSKVKGSTKNNFVAWKKWLETVTEEHANTLSVVSDRRQQMFAVMSCHPFSV